MNYIIEIINKPQLEITFLDKVIISAIVLGVFIIILLIYYAIKWWIYSKQFK